MTDARAMWRRRTEIPMLIAAIVFLAVYAWPILESDLAAGWRVACEVVLWATWAAFAADYVVQLRLADRRWHYVVRNLPELALVVLPLLRPLRVLRVVTAFAIMGRRAGTSVRGKAVTYASCGACLIIFTAALAVLDAERAHPDAQIQTFGDALWWAFVSTTTVGYGDLVPVTASGRLVAVGLMVTGIALLGTVTAALASWLVERVGDEQQATRSDVARLTAEVRELKAMIARLEPANRDQSDQLESAGRAR